MADNAYESKMALDKRYAALDVQDRRDISQTIIDHLNVINRLSLRTADNVAEIERRVEAIERFLGVSFVTPVENREISDLEFKVSL